MGQQIFQAIGTIKDAMPVMTTPPTIADRADTADLKVETGEIRFENVYFAYKAGKPVIEDLSLTSAPARRSVSSASRARARHARKPALALLRYQGGHGLIDGQDMRTVSQASLRRAIGVIAQDVALLHRSVGDNIRYGRPEASE